jgi:chromatin remodeling complex protein RSC6
MLRATPSASFNGADMAKKSAKKPARKPNAAFMKPVTPSASLAAVIGDKPMPRTEVTKKLWAYIKKNGLQDQKNKRMIKADDKLKPVFGGKAIVNMFEMTKLVSKHLK